MNRRLFIGTAAGASAIGLAGCLGSITGTEMIDEEIEDEGEIWDLDLESGSTLTIELEVIEGSGAFANLRDENEESIFSDGTEEQDSFDVEIEEDGTYQLIANPAEEGGVIHIRTEVS